MEEMPAPAADESQTAFMSRCVDHMLNCNYGDMTSKEASAHCSIVWDNRDTKARKPFRVVEGGAAAKGGSEHQPNRRVKPTMTTKMTVTEQISAFEAKRALRLQRAWKL